MPGIDDESVIGRNASRALEVVQPVLSRDYDDEPPF